MLSLEFYFTLVCFWESPGESCQTTEGSHRGGPGPGALTWFPQGRGPRLGYRVLGPVGAVRCLKGPVLLHRNSNSQGTCRAAGLLPLGGAFQELGAHSPFPLCVINSGAGHVSGTEAGSELPAVARNPLSRHLEMIRAPFPRAPTRLSSCLPLLCQLQRTRS